jgi:antirestriction protein ArdC
MGTYYPASDIVAVDPAAGAMNGLGREDGYYATLIHELLHATATRRVSAARQPVTSPTVAMRASWEQSCSRRQSF